MSFAHPDHFRDSPTVSASKDSSGKSTAEDEDIDGAEGNEIGAEHSSDSEGDVDEQYEEEGDLPISLWMDVLIAESIRNGRVECVPAPVRSFCLVPRVLGALIGLRSETDNPPCLSRCDVIRIPACQCCYDFRCILAGRMNRLDNSLSQQLKVLARRYLAMSFSIFDRLDTCLTSCTYLHARRCG